MKAKNVLILHTENFELKTLLNRTENDSKIVNLNYESTKVKLEESIKAINILKESHESQLTENEQKCRDLLNENKVLLSTIEEITKAENKSSVSECENCIKYVSQSIESQEKIRILESDLHHLKEEKSKFEQDYSSQMKTVKNFQDEQIKLREEINQLNGLKFGFDATFKSKLNEIDNLNCQLESTTQRLEVREQRINELTNQLIIKTNEEHNLNVRISKLTEKFSGIENEILNYKEKLSQSMEENNLLVKNFNRMESELKEKTITVSQMAQRLNETLSVNTDLENSLQVSRSNFEQKMKEYSLQAQNLKEKIDELNYSIKIYEKQCGSLEMELQAKKTESESARIAEKRAIEMYQSEKCRNEIEMERNSQLNENIRSQMIDKDFKIKELDNLVKNMETKILEKDKEIESLTLSSNNCDQELKKVQKQLTVFHEESKLHHHNNKIIENLKLDCNNKTKKLQKYKKNSAEMKEKIEVLGKEMLEQREKFETLQNALINAENCVEKLKVKLSCTQDDLEHKKESLECFIKKQESEQSQLLQRLHSSEKERDECLKKLRSNDGIISQLENELKRNKEDIEKLTKEVFSLKDDILIKEKTNAKLGNKITTLFENLKSSQINVVDRSREIDRLEQVVRDRSEQIEIRSNQLEIFEKDLETGLKESQDQIHEMKSQNLQLSFDLEEQKNKNEELSHLLFATKQKNEELSDLAKLNEENCLKLKDQIIKMENESKILDKDIHVLKDEVLSKSNIITELLNKLDTKEKEIDTLTDESESKGASLKSKLWQIRQIEDKVKREKHIFIETEAKLKAEIKVLQKKLDSFNADKKKDINFAMKKLTNNFKSQSEELFSSKKNLQILKENLDDMSIKLHEKEEQISELKSLINTQSAVMIDMEGNCRLKEVVIEKLLQKISNLTLPNWSEDRKELQIENISELNQMKTEDLEKCQNRDLNHEDISLQELLDRIDKRLSKNNEKDDNL